ncbi:hypothetical protein THAOC_05505, partial [Thalassiosira oceanica]
MTFFACFPACGPTKVCSSRQVKERHYLDRAGKERAVKKRGGGYGFGLGGLALPTSTHLISIVSSRHKFESYDGTMDSSSSLTAAAPSLPPLPPQGVRGDHRREQVRRLLRPRIRPERAGGQHSLPRPRRDEAGRVPRRLAPGPREQEPRRERDNRRGALPGRPVPPAGERAARGAPVRPGRRGERRREDEAGPQAE